MSGAIETCLSTSAITAVACKSSHFCSIRSKTDVVYGRCYWWPIGPPPTDEGEYKMGLNTNNVNPELLRFVDRKFEYSVLMSPLRSKDTAHPDDPAKY
jgi:hypothetical protein